MYTQFFGNYLLSHDYINQEQLFSAMQKKAETRMKLGTLAIHAGYMTSEEVDHIHICQTKQDRKFGELAIENGYLTEDQILELLKAQSPDFLLLGQILVDEGVFSNGELANIITDYRSENEIIDLEMTEESRDAVDRLFQNFFTTCETSVSELGKMYCELLFNNFIRFVGSDYTPLAINLCDAFPVEHCVFQKVNGPYSVISYINMDEPTAIEFASRYVGEQFDEFDEYVQASLEDFLNLHNGLFTVNVSNSASMDLSITAPSLVEDEILMFENTTYDFPILYSFGIVHFILQIVASID